MKKSEIIYSIYRNLNKKKEKYYPIFLFVSQNIFYIIIIENIKT